MGSGTGIWLPQPSCDPTSLCISYSSDKHYLEPFELIQSDLFEYPARCNDAYLQDYGCVYKRWIQFRFLSSWRLVIWHVIVYLGTKYWYTWSAHILVVRLDGLKNLVSIGQVLGNLSTNGQLLDVYKQLYIL